MFIQLNFFLLFSSAFSNNSNPSGIFYNLLQFMLVLKRFHFLINHFFLQISNWKCCTKTSSWTQLSVFSEEFVLVMEFLFPICD